MISRGVFLRKSLAVVAASMAALVLPCLAGCGADEGAPIVDMNKSKDESQKESEQLPGIPVQDPAKKARR